MQQSVRSLKNTRCLKHHKKVAFNVASEVSYVLENLKLTVKKVLPDRSVLIGQKWVENAKNSNATF